MLTPTIAFEWETKTGQILKIKDMSTQHINNCINYIQNLSPFESEYREVELKAALNGFFLELRLRNEKF